MNAWLLTWEGIEDNALLDDDNKIVTILSGRTPQKTVELIVDVLYTRCLWTADDIRFCANKRKERERLFKSVHGLYCRIFYGNKPSIFIYARRVKDLVIEKDEDQRVEHVCWREYPYLIQNSDGKIIEKEPESVIELTRTLIPLSAEIYPRKHKLANE